MEWSSERQAENDKEKVKLMAQGAALMCWMEMQWTHVEAAALPRTQPEGNPEVELQVCPPVLRGLKEWQCHHLQESKICFDTPSLRALHVLTACSVLTALGSSSQDELRSWLFFPQFLTHLVPDLPVHKILLHLESFKGSFLHLNLRDRQNPA